MARMSPSANPTRRSLLQRLAIGLSLAPLALDVPRARAADLPLLSEEDPAAKAQHYVADASRAQGAAPDALCSNCTLYGGPDGSTQGPCRLFPGKFVQAAGWCKSWSAL
jgi:hypothetical protein